MTCITQSRQRSVWLLLLVALLLSLSLVACDQQVVVSGTNSTNASNSNAAFQQQPYQSAQPAQSQSGNIGTTTNSLQSTDQQVQSIMGQLDGAHNDVNKSNATSSQDNGQQP